MCLCVRACVLAGVSQLLQCNDEQCQYEYRFDGCIEWAAQNTHLVRHPLVSIPMPRNFPDRAALRRQDRVNHSQHNLGDILSVMCTHALADVRMHGVGPHPTELTWVSSVQVDLPWQKKPAVVLMIKKPNSIDASKAFEQVANFLHNERGLKVRVCACAKQVLWSTED